VYRTPFGLYYEEFGKVLKHRFIEAIGNVMRITIDSNPYAFKDGEFYKLKEDVVYIGLDDAYLTRNVFHAISGEIKYLDKHYISIFDKSQANNVLKIYKDGIIVYERIIPLYDTDVVFVYRDTTIKIKVTKFSYSEGFIIDTKIQ
jgi:hypothetical protein